MELFEKCLRMKKERSERSTHDCPSTELNKCIAGLVALLEVKIEKVKEPLSLQCLVSNIERHLKYQRLPEQLMDE